MNKVPLVLGLFLILISSSPARASSSVVINEFLPHPSASNEWIELYNPTSQIINISGWKIKDNLDINPRVIKEFSNEEITPNNFVVIDVTDKLNNGGDHIGLFNGQDQLIDSKSYTSSALETSIGRSPDGSDNWASFPAPSKGKTNGSTLITTTPTPTISTAGLSLSEFYPYPHSGESEWVEIYNDNVTTSSLNGFKIYDSEGGSLATTLVDETIPPKGYFYLQFDSKLNNSGDTVRFLSPDGGLIDSYTYTSATQGSSWAKRSTGWEETTTPTMGNSNQFAQTLASTTTPTPTKKVVTEAPKETASSPTPTKDSKRAVLGEETATSSSPTATNKIKLSFEDEEKAKVLGKSANNYLSWGLILLGLIVVAIPSIIIIRKKRG